jgi:tryptophan-rich sensory protein
MIRFQSVMALAIWTLICLGAAVVGSRFTTPEIGGWYLALRKPSWNPPNWVFAPVWTLLYLSMATAAWLVWRRAGISGAKPALALFILQLALNVGWSAIFFRAHRTGLAFAEIIVLWLLILATAVAFSAVERAAAWLMAPYLGWVTFAAALNYSIWKLNG